MIRRKTESIGRAFQVITEILKICPCLFFHSFYTQHKWGKKVTKDFISMIERVTHTVISETSDH